MHVAMKIDYVKRPIDRVNIDTRMLHHDKLRLFANAYIEYCIQTLWSHSNEANKYLNFVGKAVLKYFDITCNITKSYCYYPTADNKRAMYNGITGHAEDPTKERPELS